MSLLTSSVGLCAKKRAAKDRPGLRVGLRSPTGEGFIGLLFRSFQEIGWSQLGSI